MYIVIFLLVLAVLSWTVILSKGDRKIIVSPPEVMEYQGQLRGYRTIAPNKLETGGRLIVAFHGLGSSSRQQAYFSGLHNIVGSDTVVVYPDATTPIKPGVKTGWNAKYCCGSGWVNNIDDVGFSEALIQSLVKKYSLDSNKIFAVGFSNGGMFAHRLATEKPDLLAGFAAVSASIGANGEWFKPSLAVPAILMHGQKDTTVPYSGGVGATDSDFTWIGFDKAIESWASANRCSQRLEDNTDDTIEVSFEKCSASFKAITYKNDGHKWHGWRLANFWRRQSTAGKQIISFFDQLK